MRTERYGEIKEINSHFTSSGILSIPLQISKKERWICHYIEMKGNGNYLLEGFALIDNYGEIYFFGGGGDWIYWDLDEYSWTKNKNIYDIINNDKSLKCQSKENLDIAFTDIFIDLLKSSYAPHLDITKFSSDNIIRHERRKIENFVKQLIEINKKVNSSIEESFDIIHTLQEKIDEIQNDEIQKKKNWKKQKDMIEGKVKEDDKFFVLDLLYEDTSKYSGFQVMGSWDDWAETYDMVHSSDRYSIYLNSMPLYGKHHYKLKKNGEWVEPTENDLREKDADGNWNFVLFIHT